jgi:hypothetical protein
MDSTFEKQGWTRSENERRCAVEESVKVLLAKFRYVCVLSLGMYVCAKFRYVFVCTKSESERRCAVEEGVKALLVKFSYVSVCTYTRMCAPKIQESGHI